MHGLGYSPDSKTLAVVSIASNSITLIDPATNKVKGKVYVGRSPHEAFFTPGRKRILGDSAGRELHFGGRPCTDERDTTNGTCERAGNDDVSAG